MKKKTEDEATEYILGLSFLMFAFWIILKML